MSGAYHNRAYITAAGRIARARRVVLARLKKVPPGTEEERSDKGVAMEFVPLSARWPELGHGDWESAQAAFAVRPKLKTD